MDTKELIETKLEPECAAVVTGGIEQAAIISTAISLRWIADALVGSERQYGLIDAILELRPTPQS